MALLHLLLGVAGELDLSLVAAHFDHGARPGSRSEAERVRAWARELGVSCRVDRADPGLERTQAAFRSARYRFLRAVSRDVGAARIATGHQADDQAETVLFRILRGTGIHGLGGIPARRGIVVRPLLPFARREILAFLSGRGVEYLEDPSNRDPRWERARLRQEVLPALERSWGRPVRDRLVALSRAARRADRALEARAREALDRVRVEGDGEWDEASVAVSLEAARALDRETAARVVRRVARGRGIRLTRRGTRAAMEFISEGRSGTSVDIGGGMSVAREFGTLWIGRREPPAPDAPLRIEGPGHGRGDLRLQGRSFRVDWGEAVPASGDGTRVELALGRLVFPLTVRGWAAGDRIRTHAGTRKLKKLFGEERVPVSRRGRVPVLVMDDGRVAAVGGLAVAAGLEAGEEERRFVIGIQDA